MKLVSIAFLVVIIAVRRTTCGNNCSETNKVCEFYLELDHHLTMMRNKDLVFPYNGYIYKYDVINTSSAVPIDINEVITADGWEQPRLVAVFNNTMPGPPIIVYEGQEVIVHVKNKLKSESVTIHWHGLHQTGTPWMDGVPFVTQCPILPGQTFTYTFKAEPKGTFWYHSHMGSQLTMGAFGAFIINEKGMVNAMPEHIMTIQDWNHDWDADIDYMKMLYGVFEERKRVNPSTSIDGTSFSMFMMQSGLINGRGRSYNPRTGQNNGAPLEVFQIQQGHTYRFRVIGAGALYPFRISIDEHNLTIVASDGFDLESVVAESFIIYPGERFDFILHADKPVSNYWIRGITLEAGKNHTAEAILQYKRAPIKDPSTSRQACTQNNPCIVVNCPFSYFPASDHTKCMTFDQLRSKDDTDPAPNNLDKFKEFFLNFAFPGTNSTPASVNGLAFEQPSVSALTQSQELYSSCDRPDCGEEKVCRCTHSISVDYGDTVQMVLLNMGIGKGWSHPIHLHGHSFYVVKMGYGQYNVTTATFIEDNLNIDCRGNPNRSMSFCNNATWANTTWLGGNVPGLELKRPPRKDTIIVPTGSYIVIRLKADNPGLWNFHCHVDLHNVDGMQMLVNESFSNIPKSPVGFPVCWNFPSDYRSAMGMNTVGDDSWNANAYKATIGVLAVILSLEFFVMVGICIYYRRTKSITSGDNAPLTYSNFSYN
ncbi:hypothetical protein CHS0354_009546 [Potamilus streckersoni]|uniref:Laccase n=1 Tax=Potamilus streckersoni TaxID=2493646 RepID=A0AAE0VZI5_9BIVA|nr:hypothetical protein CHS0354_009546 [Potamilus streckersoni]